MSAPRIAAVVTCFNLGRYLPEALASIQAQTCRDFEVCVVDDGSTDRETLEVLERLPSGVRLVRTGNRGLSAARNAGVAHTTAGYICAVDADDLLLPTLFEQSAARLDRDPSLTFVSHWLEAFGDESWTWTPESCELPNLLATNTVNGAALVRRTAVNAVGGWDEGMRDGLEDWDLWITLVERGFRGEIIPEILFKYRRRSDSMSRVKFADGGHARLYRRLADKHPEAFRTHLAALVATREAALASVCVRADDLELQLEMQLLPERARARDDLADAIRRRARWDAHVERERERSETAAERRAHEGMADEVAALHAEVGSQKREADALRASLSWRLTRPLRAVGGLFIRTRQS